MTRQEIEQNVTDFLIDDLEIEQDVITPEARLNDDLGLSLIHI